MHGFDWSPVAVAVEDDPGGSLARPEELGPCFTPPNPPNSLYWISGTKEGGGGGGGPLESLATRE